MKKPTIANALVGEVGMTGQLSNLLSQAAPDEAHQNKKPTNAKAMVGEVGAARFELATSWSQTRRDNRATLRPAKLGCKNKGSYFHYKIAGMFIYPHVL